MTLTFGTGALAGVDLSDPQTHARRDLRPIWRRLRDEQPVAWHPVKGFQGGGFWVVTRHADALTVYRDSVVYTSTRGNVLATLLAGGDPAGGKMLVVSDGPRTLAIRRRLLKAFTPAALRELGVHITALTRRLVLEAVHRDVCEFASEIAEHIPLAAICDLLLIPEADRKPLLKHAQAALASTSASATERDARMARNEILMYFARLSRARKDEVTDDLLGLLLQLTREPLALSTQELLLNCYSLLLGGDETSRLSMIGLVKAFAEWPEQWALLRGGAVRLETAVEELLRWTTPTLHAGRTATVDTTLAGQAIAAGQLVTVWNSAANFDPEAFEQPERLDLTRRPNRHLSFGHGHHFCLGAQLARVELRALLEALLETTEAFEIVGEPQPLYSNFLSGYSSLRVRLHARRDAP